MRTGCPSLLYMIFVNKLLYVFALLLIFCSCNSKKEKNNEQKIATQDSSVLKVALMPTLDCLPFYYAERCGLFEKIGLDAQLITFNAQLSCDTAFERGKANIAYTDLVRALLLQNKGINLKVFMRTDGRHELLTAKSKRINSIKQLNEHLISIARHSVTDLLLDTIIAQARLDPFSIYHPQINDIVLRYNMLSNATTDAAFLPEPYATQARLNGDRSIYDSGKQNIFLMAFMINEAVLNDKKIKEQAKLLIKGYNQAVEQINKNVNHDVVRDVLMSWGIDQQTIDSLSFPVFSRAQAVSCKDMEIAAKFIRSRALVDAAFNVEGVLDSTLIH